MHKLEKRTCSKQQLVRMRDTEHLSQPWRAPCQPRNVLYNKVFVSWRLFLCFWPPLVIG
jgi:hypothetical protein